MTGIIRRQMKLRLLWVLIGLGIACVSTAQDDAARPLRVHVIGASVSGGFRDGPLWGAKEVGDSVTLQHVLKRWAAGEARVTTHNTLDMARFFADPIGIGAKQLQGVQKVKADVVVAIDFAFWFAYGGVPGDDETQARSERLEAGLDLLADLEVPVLLGDLPDMHGAARRMLRPSWIPPKTVLAALNVQLRAFCARHDHVRLVELSDVVRRMRHEGIALPLRDGPVPTPKGALQQADRLHATRLGVAYISFMLQDPLSAAFPAQHVLRKQRWAFEAFVTAAGAEAEVEEFAAAAKAGGR